MRLYIAVKMKTIFILLYLLLHKNIRSTITLVWRYFSRQTTSKFSSHVPGAFCFFTSFVCSWNFWRNFGKPLTEIARPWMTLTGPECPGADRDTQCGRLTGRLEDHTMFSITGIFSHIKKHEGVRRNTMFVVY